MQAPSGDWLLGKSHEMNSGERLIADAKLRTNHSGEAPGRCPFADKN